MRYSKEHTAAVRRRLVREGGRDLKQRGLVGAGVDGIANRVGLSGAALYTHFASKQAFQCAVLREELGVTARRFVATHAARDARRGDRELAALAAPAARLRRRGRRARGNGGASVTRALRSYVSLAHARAPELGCPLPALASEIARSGRAVQRAFADGWSEVIDALAAVTGGRASARGALAAAVGAVVIARALPDDREAIAVLAAARRLISDGLDAKPTPTRTRTRSARK